MAYVTGATGGSVGTPGRMVMPHFDPSVLNIDTVGIMSKGFDLGKRMYNARQDREDELKLRAAQIKDAEASASSDALKLKEAEDTYVNRVKAINDDAALNATVKARLVEQEKQNYDNYLSAAKSAAEAEAILKRGAAAQAPDVVAASGAKAKTDVFTSTGDLARAPQGEEIKDKTQSLQAGVLAGMTPEKPYSLSPVAPGMFVAGIPGKDGVSFETVRPPAGILNQGTGPVEMVPLVGPDGKQLTDENKNPLYQRQQGTFAGGTRAVGSVVKGMTGTGGTEGSSVLANAPAPAQSERVPNPLAPKPDGEKEQPAQVKTAVDTLPKFSAEGTANMRNASEKQYVRDSSKISNDTIKALASADEVRANLRNIKAVAEQSTTGLINRVQDFLPTSLQSGGKVDMTALMNNLIVTSAKANFTSRITDADLKLMATVKPDGSMRKENIMSLSNYADAIAQRAQEKADFLQKAQSEGKNLLAAEVLWSKYANENYNIEKNKDTGIWELVDHPSIDEWINTPKKKEEKPSASTSGTPEAKKSGRFTIESVE